MQIEVSMRPKVSRGIDTAGICGCKEREAEGDDGGAGVDSGAEVGVGGVAEGAALEGEGGGRRGTG